MFRGTALREHQELFCLVSENGADYRRKLLYQIYVIPQLVSASSLCNYITCYYTRITIRNYHCVTEKHKEDLFISNTTDCAVSTDTDTAVLFYNMSV